MIYILYDSKTYSFKPEIEYGNGQRFSFTNVFFLFDESKKYVDIESSICGLTVTINGYDYYITKDLSFNNPKKAEIAFLRLKIKELQHNSFEFILPDTFQKFVARYKKLKIEFPESVI